MSRDTRRGRTSLPRRDYKCCSFALSADQVGRRNERLLRDELLPDLLVDRDRRQVRVAGRVDREVADDAAGDVKAEDGLVRLRAVTAAGRNGLQHDLHRLSAVLGVRIRLGADLLAEALDEGRT